MLQLTIICFLDIKDVNNLVKKKRGFLEFFIKDGSNRFILLIFYEMFT